MKLQKVKSHWNERWRKLETEYPTVKNDYYISDYGRIIALEKASGSEKLLKGSKSRSGHSSLNIRLREDKRKSTYIHKFVAEHFIERTAEDIRSNRVFVDHIDGDKENNHFSNLRWLNRGELTEVHKERGVISNDKYRKTLTVKMTEAKVKLLKKRLKEGKTKKKILARTFNISLMQLSRIERGINWANVSID